MDAVIFHDSPDYILALRGFFDAFMDFWIEALTFSKRKRLRTMLRAGWSNYVAEFGALQIKMERHQKALLQCAEATSRKLSHEARIKEEDERSKSEAARKGMSIVKETFMLISGRIAG